MVYSYCYYNYVYVLSHLILLYSLLISHFLSLWLCSVSLIVNAMSLYFVCHSHFPNSSTTKKIVRVFGFISLIYSLLSRTIYREKSGNRGNTGNIRNSRNRGNTGNIRNSRNRGTLGTLGTVGTEGTLGTLGTVGTEGHWEH